MNAIEIRNLTVRQGKFNLHIEHLDIPQGYITGLIGENGAGKTSLIYQVLNLRTPQKGSIKIFGRDYADNREAILSEIGIVFSENHFPEWMSPKKLEKIFEMYYPNWQHDKYIRYLETFEIPYGQKIKQMSQGMKVKLNIAAALSHEAKLLILDEPTSNLDPTFRLELLNIFQELMLDDTRTILFSTHITSDLEHIADYIAFIENGELSVMEEKDELMRGHHIVKGRDALLDDELDQLLIGLEVQDNHFIGMTKEAQVFKELFGDKVVIQPVTIDQFMYYKKKERRKVKVYA